METDELRELLEEVDRPRGCLALPDSVSVLVLVLCVGLESGGDELLSPCDSSLDGESERLLSPCDSSSLDCESERLLSPCDSSSLDGKSEQLLSPCDSSSLDGESERLLISFNNEHLMLTVSTAILQSLSGQYLQRYKVYNLRIYLKMNFKSLQSKNLY